MWPLRLPWRQRMRNTDAPRATQPRSSRWVLAQQQPQRQRRSAEIPYSCRMCRRGHPHLRALQPQVRKGSAVQPATWALKAQRGVAGATVWRADGAAPGADGTVLGGPGVWPVGPLDGRGRARGIPLTSIPLGDKIALIEIKDAGHSLAQTLAMFSLNISPSAAWHIYRKGSEYKRRAAASEELSAPRLRRSYFESVSQSLWRWYRTLQRVGGRHLPVSGGLLEARARQIATDLGVTGFKGSPYLIQNWAARHKLQNVTLWGQGGSADIEAVAASISEIRAQLEAYPAEQIYNMDETGLFYRCIPNQAYVEAGQRKQARGTNAMQAKDRITLVLACNTTGTHIIPAAIISKAKLPLCFKRPRQPCPLPYFSQQSAWMDGVILKSWSETVFLPAVRARTSQPVALMSYDCGAHAELECEKVKLIPLPPNCTSVYQPLDLGIIAYLKRRYKRRLLDLVVSAFENTTRFRAAVEATSAAEAGIPATPLAQSAAMPSTTGVLPAAAAGASAAPSAESATVGRVKGAPTVAGPGGAPMGVTISAATAGLAAGRADTGSVAGGESAGMRQSAGPASGPVPRVSSMAIAVTGAMTAAMSAARRASATDAGPHSGATPSMEGALAEAAAVAPPVVVFGNGSGTPSAAAGPGIWGSPSDGPAAEDPRQPIRRRSRTRAPPVVMRDVRDSAAAHLQDASEILKAEWEAVEPATIAHCWVKSTILPNGLAMDVTAVHGE